MNFKKTTSSLLFAAILALENFTPLPASASDIADANKLIIEAIQEWKSAEAVSGEDTAAVRLRHEKLTAAEYALDQIVAKHSGSDLAVKLVIGESIGPLSMQTVKDARIDAELTLNLHKCAQNPSARCVIEHARRLYNTHPDEMAPWELRDIAATQVEAGFFDDSLSTADAIEDLRYREQATSDTSIGLSKAGRIDDALTLASELTSSDYSSQAYEAIVLAYIAANQPQKGSSLISKISEEKTRQDTTRELASAFAMRGQFSEAEALMTQLDDYEKSSVMQKISEYHVLNQDYLKAWEVASEIPIGYYLCYATLNVAMSINSDKTISKIVAYARDFENTHSRYACLRHIGIKTNRADLLKEARGLTAESGYFETFFAAREELEAGLVDEAYLTALTEYDPRRRSEILSNVAQAAIKAGRIEYAKGLLPMLLPTEEVNVRGALWSVDGEEVHIERARRLAANEDDAINRASRMSSFVLYVDNVKRLERAAHIATSIANGPLREGAIGSIAQTYAKAGYFTEAIQTIGRITRPDYQIEELLEIAEEMTLHQTGH